MTTLTHPATYKTLRVNGNDVFYREAGDPSRPVVLLLHGFPTSSHMFRELIPQLAGDYHVIAPDLPGFGNTVTPPRGQFDYTFDNLAKVIIDFVNTLGLTGTFYFQYGTSSTAFTTSTAKAALPASTTRTEASTGLTGLTTKTKYYYQVVVTTAGGTTTGGVQSFTTN